MFWKRDFLFVTSEKPEAITVILTSFFFTSCKKETYGGNPNPSSGSASSSGTNCSSSQCTGFTQAGPRCKRMTTNCSGRCYQH